ncbi:MAG: hypothetical protein ACRC1T_09135 [Clostridium chrysemydis]|uniref:hypothetical protein n=1 Tax=Clostridium chrysemydis TaxID=2665504 RepID=UPI003F3FA6A9
MKAEFYLDPQSDILFMKGSNGYYEPFAVEYNKDDGSCRVIADDPILMEVYEFVNYFQRRRDNKGRWRSSPIFPYQWSFIFRHVLALLARDGSDKLESYARQTGKSYSIKLLLAWEMVFLPRYIEVKLERYTCILCSYKKESVEKLFGECKTAIYKAVEYHNKKYKEKLVTKNGEFSNPKLIDSSTIVEINKMFTDGDEIPYSKCTSITLGASNDGLSSFHTIVDEAGLCDFDLFQISVAPFSASVNGMCTFIGLPNQDSSNLLQRMYQNKTVKKVIYDAHLAYEMRKMVDKQFAEDYKKHLDGVIASNGRNSSFVQWNYFINFMDMNGKFVTKEVLDNSKILCNSIHSPINNTQDKSKYLVAGLDISPKKDFRVLTLMETDIVNGDVYNSVFDIKTYNKDKTRMEHEHVAEQVANDLRMYKIDMLCIDSTSHQSYFVQTLRKKIKEIGINTLIIPFYYNQSTKPRLFGFLETTLFGGRLKLLKENESWESEKLVEEMCYMIKEKGKKDSDVIKYYAPEGGDFTDDHVNSLALANICFTEAFEKFRKKEWADDGAKRWKIKLNKFSELIPVDIHIGIIKKKTDMMYEVPI